MNDDYDEMVTALVLFYFTPTLGYYRINKNSRQLRPCISILLVNNGADRQRTQSLMPYQFLRNPVHNTQKKILRPEYRIRPENRLFAGARRGEERRGVIVAADYSS